MNPVKNGGITLRLRVDTNKGHEELLTMSDGLCGELYSEDGWFARFSKYGDKLHHIDVDIDDLL